MAALGRIEKIGDRAENDDEAGAQKRKHRDQNNGDNGQDQDVFDQGLPFPAVQARRSGRQKGFHDGCHFR